MPEYVVLRRSARWPVSSATSLTLMSVSRRRGRRNEVSVFSMPRFTRPTFSSEPRLKVFSPCINNLKPPTIHSGSSCMIHFCYAILILFMAYSCPNREGTKSWLDLARHVSAKSPSASGQLTVASLSCLHHQQIQRTVLYKHAVKQRVPCGQTRTGVRCCSL